MSPATSAAFNEVPHRVDDGSGGVERAAEALVVVTVAFPETTRRVADE